MTCDLRLARHGAVLIVLGLLSGFATAVVPAPRAALASHTIGIVQGTLTIAVAFLWPVLTAQGHKLELTRWGMLVGFYCNWIGALLAGVWSARRMMLVNAGAMPEISSEWQEIVVMILLNASMLSLLAFIHLVVVTGKVIASTERA